MCQLDPEGRSVEGLPGGQDEGERGGARCLAPNQAWRSPYIGTRAGGMDETLYLRLIEFVVSTHTNEWELNN